MAFVFHRCFTFLSHLTVTLKTCTRRAVTPMVHAGLSHCCRSLACTSASLLAQPCMRSYIGKSEHPGLQQSAFS